MNLLQKYNDTKKPDDNLLWWMYRKVMSHIPMYVKRKRYLQGEHCISKGKEYPNDVFYIIRPNGNSCGLMSLYYHVLLGIKYAKENGYIPVIDFANYINMYRNKGMKHDNSWEYYFLQPADFDLKMIKKAKNIIIGQIQYSQFHDLYSESTIREAYKCISHIEYNSIVKKYITDEYKRIIESTGKTTPKILGVLGRGTDYVSLEPHKHSRVPDVDMLINKTDEMIDKWGGFDYIFIATEDMNILDCFKIKYGNRLLYTRQERYGFETKGKALCQIHKKRKNDNYYRGLEYLSTIDFLSKCDSLITSDVGGARVATWMNNNKYNNIYIFDLGYYK